jgi:hypothetical protein
MSAVPHPAKFVLGEVFSAYVVISLLTDNDMGLSSLASLSFMIQIAIVIWELSSHIPMKISNQSNKYHNFEFVVGDT